MRKPSIIVAFFTIGVIGSASCLMSMNVAGSQEILYCQMEPAKPPAVDEPAKPAAEVDEPIFPKWIYYGQIPSDMRDDPAYPYATLINEVAMEMNVDPNWMFRVAGIESGYNPHNSTGSYHGLFQLSNFEFARHGGGNIYDPRDNARAAALMFREQRDQFAELFGRYPDEAEAYMIHQQGIEGCAAHLLHPDAPAWENMHSTGEGQQRGASWSRLAIWGNLPPIAHQRYGSVDAVTSRQFVDVWRSRVTTGSWPVMW
jgi:Transglycosylase SLT domain